MKKIFFLIIIFPMLASAQKKPNIVLIFADDLGYMDLGFTGSKTFESPNIDRLSQKGMVFPNAYAAAGNCVPSRACLMSGLYTPRHGMYAVASTTRGPRKEMKVVPVKHTKELAPGFVTMAEALREKGYATGIFGKWHLGNRAEVMPKAQGFDVYYDSSQGSSGNRKNKAEDPKGMFSLTNAAIRFMKENRTKPFFTYLAHHAIHSDLEAKPETIEYFKKKGFDNKTATYAACIYNLDQSIALLMDFLQKEGLDKNTLVIFTSDNGAVQQSSQEPLRGNKGGYYEGGIREPFIAYWPGKIKGGTTNHTPIINLDLYPTFLAVAGHNDTRMDGENLLPLFTGKAPTTKRESIFWHFPGYLNTPVNRGRDTIFRSRPVTAMRKGDWKILLYHEEWVLDGGIERINTNNAVEVYNLKEDGGEWNNLASLNKRKRDELLNDVLAWIKTTNAKLPVAIDSAHQLEPGEGSNDN